MFSIGERDRLRDAILLMADTDPRIVAGAIIGSLALGDGDRWSDLDLTFGVADGTPVTDVLEDWTLELAARFDAVRLFDLPWGPTIYRVFLLPGCLQVDLSFTPAARFGARGPKFRLLFGRAGDSTADVPSPVCEVFGQAVHHAIRAHFAIERCRVWQAAHWINELRDCAMSLACRRRDLPASHGRGFDDLPEYVLHPFAGAIARSLDHDELRRALRCAVDALFLERDQAGDIAGRVERRLRDLIAPAADPA